MSPSSPSLSRSSSSSSQSSASRSTSTENQRQTPILNSLSLTGNTYQHNMVHSWLEGFLTSAQQGLQVAGQYTWNGFMNLAVFVAQVQNKQEEYNDLAAQPTKKTTLIGGFKKTLTNRAVEIALQKRNVNFTLKAFISYIVDKLPLGAKGIAYVSLDMLGSTLMSFYPESTQNKPKHAITKMAKNTRPLQLLATSSDGLVPSPAIRATSTLAIEQIPNGFATSSLQGVTNSLSESLQESTFPELLQVFVEKNIPNYQSLQTQNLQNLQSLQQAKQIIKAKIANLTNSRSNDSNPPKLFSLNTLIKGLKNTPSNLQILFEKSKLTLINLKLKAISNQQQNSIIKNILNFLNTQENIGLNSKPGKKLLKIVEQFNQLQPNKQDTRSEQILIKKAGICLKKLSIENKNSFQKARSNSPSLNATSKFKGLTQSIRTLLSSRLSSYDSSNSSELGSQDEGTKDLLQEDKATLLNLFAPTLAQVSPTNQPAHPDHPEITFA